ncbi:Hypothetical predicted protein [Mytilus galloprovincialis]|uniref:Uncharacterized protein n=1 Tax=Mytilus galloprovincialis TaxID=29158 RepID=A0A8B6DM02_MYTGA|nr:Hypothetical predicted protein [Mytilus galloprovincialis]
MIYDCEHTKGSMFSTGPCDDCRNRIDGFKNQSCNKQTKIHCYTPTSDNGYTPTSDNGYTPTTDSHIHKQRTFQVKWADNHKVIPDVEEVNFVPRITKRYYKPILKHRASCVIFVHNS